MKTLKRYLYGEAALETYAIPYLRGRLYPQDAYIPKSYIVFTDENLYLPEHTHIHLCKIPGAERFTQGQRCSLPLVFLQLAAQYELPRLIYLGLILCSYNQGKKAFCTKEELLACATKLIGHKGRRKALRALRYVREGCRSPQEALSYLFLRLPMCHGGCGFSRLIFNHRIVCTQRPHTYFADLYDPHYKVVIEYDSRQFHNRPEEQERDLIRKENLEAEGYKVISISPEQLSQLKLFDALIKNIARALHKKLIVRARKYFKNFPLLRNLLLGSGKTCDPLKKTVSLREIPHLTNVKRIFNLYLRAWHKRNFYPELDFKIIS